MDNTLQHHGILGMRWGVRRYQNADGTLTEAGKKRYGNTGEVTQNTSQVNSKSTSTSNNGSKTVDNTKTKTPKNVKSMTDAELTAAISRMKLEKQYKEYFESSEGKEAVEKGKSITSSVLSEVGGKIAKTALTGAGIYAISAAASGKWDREKFGEAIFNGGAKKK